MSLLAMIKVCLTFVEREIFNEVGFQVDPGERIGLVGPNGSGKTTLLRLMTGDVAADSGEVRIARGVRMGYLRQDVQDDLTGPLLETVVNSVPGRIDCEKEISLMEGFFSEGQDGGAQSERLEKLAELHQEKEALDQNFPRFEAEKILTGLGFNQEELKRSISELSGGWKTRAGLACLLYQKPELLLLDEPTNYLDIPSVHWLEGYLQDFKGAMILVSHDREFLNRQVSRIISLEPEGLRSYSGNYDFYLAAREEEKRLLEAKARKQEQKVKDARKFIDRFRSKASKARQAQSKLKLVKKMEIIDTHKSEKKVSFRFPPVKRSGRDVLSLSGISKAFGEKSLYSDLSLQVLRGERIALIGPNGSGKTTLLKILAGEIPADSGSVRLGQGVEMGYFAQHHSEMLNPRRTVLEEVYSCVPDETMTFVRSVCGAFLFSGGDVEKPVQVLSGGERARVALAKLLVRPGNLMVMDEPTNHLDLDSSEILISALKDYGGTLLFVSHNQSFVNRLATRIWDLREGDVTVYPGNLDDYYRHLDGLDEEKISGKKKRACASEGKNKSRKEQKRERAERRRFIKEKLGPLERELESLEARIEELETTQKGVEKELADPDIFSDKDRSVPLMKQYGEIRSELEDLIAGWESCQERLESARQKLGVAEE